ncbi:MAG: hypothetical protein K6E49_02620 [Lachnospiraceae bacterium]|nr:hypothetical protein [Lachnospiraceae bacterium]
MNIFLIVLLIINYIFYSFLDAGSLALLIGLSLFTYAGGRYVYHVKRTSHTDTKKICLAVIAVQVGVLCYFKYLSGASLPVGLSFYMLMAISFIADVYRDEYSRFPSLTEVLVYISFFPTVISGPIMKSKDMIPQLSARKKLTFGRVERAIWLLAAGVFMKFVMADRLSVAVDRVYEAPLVYSGITLFLTSVAYTLQLLFDFAGYSYMATAAASLLGYDIMANFNLPYISATPSEFWRRWHISLSTWLRDYVYIPLGGSRKGKMRTYINIFLVMVISGLWHGSTVNFLIWGMLHGLGQVVHRFISENRKDTVKTPRILSMIITFLFVNFLWIPFRMPTLAGAWTVFSRIVTLAPGAAYYYTYTFIFAGVLLLTEIAGIVRANGNNPLKPLPLDTMYGRIALCVLIIATGMFAYFGSGAFIYAQF